MTDAHDTVNTGSLDVVVDEEGRPLCAEPDLCPTCSLFLPLTIERLARMRDAARQGALRGRPPVVRAGASGGRGGGSVLRAPRAAGGRVMAGEEVAQIDGPDKPGLAVLLGRQRALPRELTERARRVAGALGHNGQCQQLIVPLVHDADSIPIVPNHTRLVPLSEIVYTSRIGKTWRSR